MAEQNNRAKKGVGLLLAFVLVLGLGACGSKQEFSTDAVRINNALPQARFLIVEGSITVFDVSGKKPEKLQELTFGEVSDLEFSKEMFAAEDLNFDGNTDIRIPSLRGATNVFCYAWLWDEKANGFVFHEELSALSLLMVDPANQILTTVESGGAAENVEAAYDWVDGTLTLVWENRIFTDIGSGAVTELRTARQPDGSYSKAETLLEDGAAPARPDDTDRMYDKALAICASIYPWAVLDQETCGYEGTETLGGLLCHVVSVPADDSGTPENTVLFAISEDNETAYMLNPAGEQWEKAIEQPDGSYVLADE